MIRGKLWFRCAAMHDPVTPMVVQPALIGWEAKERRVELQIGTEGQALKYHITNEK